MYPTANDIAAQIRARLRVGTALSALTICQPYADLLLPPGRAIAGHGPKRVENRTWFTRRTGLIAIHAGKGRNWLRNAEPWQIQQVRRPLDDLELGDIVGVGCIHDCLRLSHLPAAHPLHRDPHAGGPYCFVMRWTLRLPRAIPCRGLQGFWTVSPGLVRDIADQLEHPEQQLEAPAMASSEERQGFALDLFACVGQTR